VRIASTRKGSRGTLERPCSALNLRLALASSGLVSCAVLAALAARADQPAPALVLAAPAALAAVDMVVVQLRRRARREEDGNVHRSLFE
jgi:hypothetical protein